MMKSLAFAAAPASTATARLPTGGKASRRSNAAVGMRTGLAGSWASPASAAPLRVGMQAQPRAVARASFRVYAADEDIPDVEGDAMEKMEKTMDSTQGNFASIRTGRANAALLDRIEVDYYGAPTPLNQMAGVSVPDSQTLSIQPYDMTALPNIEKAIQMSDLGLTPNNDGKVIRLNIPPLTQERRKELAKTVSKLGEEGKVALRNVRKDAMKKVGGLKKDNKVSEDEAKDLEDSVQKLTDDYVKQIDDMVKAKEDDLAKV